MDKRYQVFVSSTYEDLKEERQQVIQALLELDCIPAGMELFPAADEDQWTLIKEVIKDCDYYIVVVAGRYGSVDHDGISYTEKEYDYAVETRKPVIGFLHKDPGKIRADKTEMDAAARKKLEEFRKKVGQRTCKFWANAEELGGVISRSLVKLVKRCPAEGWVRGRYAATTEELLRLRARIDELQDELTKAKTEAPVGAERLAHGQDPVDIRYEYSIRVSDEAEMLREMSGLSVPMEQETIRLTWDEVFGTLGPLMFHEEAEHRLRMRLGDALKEKSRCSQPIASHNVNVDDFATIVVQLFALGLIQRSQRKHAATDTLPYWALSPYGEAYLMRVKAVPRSKPDPTAGQG